MLVVVFNSERWLGVFIRQESLPLQSIMLWIARRATNRIVGHRVQVMTAGVLKDPGLHSRSLLSSLSLISSATLVTPSKGIGIDLDVALISRLIQIRILIRC